MKKCDVCELSDSKYRCPTCRILYCSVGCYKSHKDKCIQLKNQKEKLFPEINTQAPANEDLEPGELTDSDSDNEDKVQPEQLSLLDSSQIIKDMLENRHLRRIIKKIDEKDDPETELESAMKLPIFVEFANECLKVVENQNNIIN